MSDAVLVVSNDANVRSALSSFIQGSGAAVEAVDVGVRGIERLQYGTLPRAVLLDVNLSEVDAPAMLRAIAQKYPELPVVMIGADVSEAETAVLMQLGASAVLAQRDIPSHMPRILEAVAQLPPTGSRFNVQQRVPTRLPIEIQTGPGQPIELYETRDVSLTGLFIRMEMPIDAGAPLRMQLQAGNGIAIDLDGVVKRAVTGGADAGIAVSFIQGDAAERDKLAALLTRLNKRGAKSVAASESALDLGQLFESAKAISENPIVNSDDSALSRGQRMLQIGSFALAEEQLALAMKDDPENEAIEFLYRIAGAREAMRLHQYDRATEAYMGLLALDPECEEAKSAIKKLVETKVRKKGVLKKLAAKS